MHALSYAQSSLEAGESIVAAHFPKSPNDLNSRAEVTAAIALANADAVDREARFPIEAIQSARDQRLLGMMVPVALGGEGASISDAVDACYIIARGCSSSAMIFAMHQIMVAILMRHAAKSPWHMRLMRRLASNQLLLASSTTEGSGGGDLRKSICAVERTGSRISTSRPRATCARPAPRPHPGCRPPTRGGTRPRCTARPAPPRGPRRTGSSAAAARRRCRPRCARARSTAAPDPRGRRRGRS